MTFWRFTFSLNSSQKCQYTKNIPISFNLLIKFNLNLIWFRTLLSICWKELIFSSVFSFFFWWMIYLLTNFITISIDGLDQKLLESKKWIHLMHIIFNGRKGSDTFILSDDDVDAMTTNETQKAQHTHTSKMKIKAMNRKFQIVYHILP